MSEIRDAKQDRRYDNDIEVEKNVLIKICDRDNHFSEEFHASNSPVIEFDDLNGSEGNFGIRHKLAILRDAIAISIL